MSDLGTLISDRTRLTDEERAAVNKRLQDEGVTAADGAGFVVWPDWAPPQYNACTDPCDMWTGPCACGAWHKDGR